jgi:hypothetical protein
MKPSKRSKKEKKLEEEKKRKDIQQWVADMSPTG